MQRLNKVALLASAVLVISINQSHAIDRTLLPQKPAERAMQEKMPIANGDVWAKLLKAKIDFDENKAVFVATVPDEVKQLNGRQVDVGGFMLPLSVNTKHSHFLLSKRTPTCPYCMPGGPTEVFDVYLKEPIEYTANMIRINGTFKLAADTKSGLYFRLENASVQ